MTYEIYFLSLFLLNFFLIFKFKYFTEKLNIYDYPNHRKIHLKPTPLFGGTIIFSNILIFFILLLLLGEPETHGLFGIFSNKQYFATLLTFNLFFFLGLYDDKYPLSSNKKLVFQFLILFFLVYYDPSLPVKKLDFLFIDDLNLNRSSTFFTVICFLFLINIMNMFDGINLQSSIVYFFIILFLLINNSYNIFLYTLLISLIFFSYLNFQGKTFLGDSGSLILALSVGYIFLKDYNLLNVTYLENFICFILFPALDALRLFLARIIKGKHIFTPDKRHIHHLLVSAIGYNKTIITILIIYTFIFILTYTSILPPYLNLYFVTILYFIFFIYLESRVKRKVSK